MQKQTSKYFAMFLAASVITGIMAGCGGNGETSSSSGSSAGSSETSSAAGNKVTLHIFNSKGENAAEFEQMCKDFEAESGIPVKAFSVGSGTDAAEPLRAQMTSKDPPAIFSMQGLKELPEWQESGTALDLNTIDDPEFKKIVEGIPEDMRLSPDGVSSYGIPYNVEGYGFMVDSQMISDLFGADNAEAVLNDLRTCSYEEFTAFCETTDQYIDSPTAAQVVLNGNSYTMQTEKTGLAQNLTGVFAFAGSEKWTYGDHTVNVALNAVLNNSREAANITDEQFEALRGPLTAYAQTLDFVTQHVGGLKGRGKRGPDLINAANFGYDQSVQMYADSNAVFLQQGNWASTNVSKVNPDVASRSSFIPVKMPITDSMIKTGRTAANFNSSIPVYVPNYYAINAKASPEAQQEAVQFLTWMNQPENIQKYIIDSFKFIPYNADSSMNITDSYSQSIIKYMDEGKTLSAPYHGAPGQWSGDILGKKIMEDYLTKETWTEQDYSDIADYAVSQWKELKDAAV